MYFYVLLKMVIIVWKVLNSYNMWWNEKQQSIKKVKYEELKGGKTPFLQVDLI